MYQEIGHSADSEYLIPLPLPFLPPFSNTEASDPDPMY